RPALSFAGARCVARSKTGAAELLPPCGWSAGKLLDAGKFARRLCCPGLEPFPVLRRNDDPALQHNFRTFKGLAPDKVTDVGPRLHRGGFQECALVIAQPDAQY